MKTKHIVGTTVENDVLTLPNGMLSIDSEKKAVRFHDGQTVGGYEVQATRAFVPPVGPGPTDLIAGDMSAGFFGEVTSTDLLSYEALAAQIGLSAGVSQFNTESLWLKFALDNQILFVAKKPARYDIEWNNVNAVNAIYENGANIAVGSDTFDVTVLRGATTDPTAIPTAQNPPETHGSEWNRLLYPIHNGFHKTSNSYVTHNDPTAAPFGTWASYSESDLVVEDTYGEGSYSMCQEKRTDGTRIVNRGGVSVMYMIQGQLGYATSVQGWRPCLRLRT